MDEPTRRAVRETYDEIGTHFSKTRAYPWPEVESFVDGVADADLAVDLGCGNGRHAVELARVADRVVCLDASRTLLVAARDRTADVATPVDLVQGDVSRLPLADNVVDLAVYVATLHHLPTRSLRIESLNELARVLTADGRALVSAWSTEHDTFDATEGFDTTVDWTLPGGETVPRFYHVYDPEEFARDLSASTLRVTDTRVVSGNCYADVVGEQKRP
jgi:ubiquinone/menaquinone biosynthesis C-methylase UbiE